MQLNKVSSCSQTFTLSVCQGLHIGQDGAGSTTRDVHSNVHTTQSQGGGIMLKMTPFCPDTVKPSDTSYSTTKVDGPLSAPPAARLW